jgi:hypothetical protein
MGTVKDSPQGGCPLSRTKTCASVAVSIGCLPCRSIQKWGAELGVPLSIMPDHVKEDLATKAFRPMFTNEL